MLTKRQIKAIAYRLIALSINADESDLIEVMHGAFRELEISDSDSLEITEQAADIRDNFCGQAYERFAKAFSKERK